METKQIKSGDENLTFNQKKLPYKLLDFWRWNVSDLLSNATRGRFAEFIVATATNIDLSTPREEWAAYDLITPDNIKIEVKSSAYIQSWHQEKLSKISFSIKPAYCWDYETNKYSESKTRYADVYVMCLLNTTNRESINPLDLTQWLFYVVSVETLNNLKNSQISITLKSLEKLANPVTYDELNNEIKKQSKQNT